MGPGVSFWDRVLFRVWFSFCERYFSAVAYAQEHRCNGETWRLNCSNWDISWVLFKDAV